MPDPGAIVEVATVGVSLRLLTRVLGPPADALGASLGRWAEYKTRNVGRVLEKADKKLGDRAGGPGRVPLRVAGAVFEEAQYCEDEVIAEYLGGVLASAKTDVGRDDRAARWARVVASLSSYEVRVHYVLYSAARELYLQRGERVSWGDESKYNELRALVDYAELVRVMEFSEEEAGENIVNESLFALNTAGLVKDFSSGPKFYIMAQVTRSCPFRDGLLFTPSTVGVQLYMWAQGLGLTWREFDSPGVQLPKIDVPTIAGSILVTDLPPVGLPRPPAPSP